MTDSRTLRARCQTKPDLRASGEECLPPTWQKRDPPSTAGLADLFQQRQYFYTSDRRLRPAMANSASMSTIMTATAPERRPLSNLGAPVSGNPGVSISGVAVGSVADRTVDGVGDPSSSAVGVGCAVVGVDVGVGGETIANTGDEMASTPPCSSKVRARNR